jgi:hypothetical protein
LFWQGWSKRRMQRWPWVRPDIVVMLLERIFEERRLSEKLNFLTVDIK